MMANETLFAETQRFKQKWLWALLIAMAVFIPGPTLLGLIRQIFYGQQFGNNPLSNNGLIILTIVNVILPIIPLVLFAYMKLETIIKDDGIYVRFLPFQLKFKYYGWSNLSQCYIRQYSPVNEYGGWGLRGFGKNKALNVSGNIGLQLETKDGNRLLIGTNQPQEVENILRKLKQYRSQ